MTVNTKLKPCPYCGGNNIDSEGGNWVTCIDCDGWTERNGKTGLGADDLWNTRPIESELLEALEDLVGHTQCASNSTDHEFIAARAAIAKAKWEA